MTQVDAGAGPFGGAPRFSLRSLSGLELEALAADRVPAALASRAEAGALPPPFVADRALALRTAGHPRPWATVFLIVDDGERIVGSCGFKSAPAAGRVDLGYGVAFSARRRGAASGAVRRLVAIGLDAGAREFLAEVAPENLPSAKVLQGAGFVSIGGHLDAFGEFVDRWLHTARPGAPTTGC